MRGVTGTQRAHPAGRVIVQVNAVLTAVFVVTSLAAAVVFDNPWKQVAVGTSLACFSVGVVAFLWGYWNAVQRSRRTTSALPRSTSSSAGSHRRRSPGA